MTGLPRLTSHQQETLVRLNRLSRPVAWVEVDPLTNGGAHRKPIAWSWVLERDCGSAGALRHLLAKGYVDVEVRHGSRGGTHRYYRDVTRRPLPESEVDGLGDMDVFAMAQVSQDSQTDLDR